ncbi:XRE family transcriptional regulator [Kiloniella spongiae]|uniref:XRE family transcriptional regulator n=1 Tax=Kiloniella spongiae TaxID=1489064 RepID=A0A0H2MY06_9PROT|nr:XRE family transcriptional regulator [Kiloniella spongiae]KLN61585.1 XRE family transcriptional regulator [Kiloniella spongiae]
MGYVDGDSQDKRLAERLRALRGEREWSLDELAGRSDISRATLSRIEKGEVSPTATVLGRLCAVYGMTMSRLMAMAEENYSPLVRRNDQVVWIDKETGLERRSVSPPSENLNCEVLDVRLKPGAEISYSSPPKNGLEHHLVLRDGVLEITIEAQSYQLQPGDCLRYKLHGANCFKADKNKGALYTLVVL